MLNYIIWNADPIAFSVGSLTFKWYGLSWGIGLLCAYFFIQFIHTKENKDPENGMKILEYLFIGALIGARLGAVFFYESQYFIQNPLEIFKIWKGGLASHGGGIGMIVALFLFVHNYPTYTYWWIIDRLAIIICLIAGLIRLGNLMNSEIYGKVTDVSWAFIFTKIDELPRHPSQLYDAFMVFGLFALFFYWYNRGKYRGAGCMTGWYFTLAFSFRTLLEFFKESAVTTQWLNVPFVVVGGFLLLRCRNNKKTLK